VWSHPSPANSSPAGLGADLGGSVSTRLLDNIVVPLDGDIASERAVFPAVVLASRLGAEVHLMTTRPSVGDRDAEEYLQHVAEGITTRGIAPISTEVVGGADPVQALAKASATDRSSVCMATHARGRLRGAIHRNTSDAVLDALVAPVFLIGPDCAEFRTDGTVLVGHDGSEHATRAIESMIPVIAALGRKVHVVTVVEAPMGKPTIDPYAATRAAIAPVVEAFRRTGLTAAHHLAFGKDAAVALLAEARAVNASLIVLAANHHSWSERIRDGSTTMDVVHDATAPVLVAHAD
jgi:nucleotide-binding universal stress UspA family protein